MSANEERKRKAAQEREQVIVEALRKVPFGLAMYGSKPDPRRPSTFTYFIQVEGPGGPLKIGCAGDPKARLLQLQTACPYELYLMGYVPGGPTLERELHAKYADLHLRGEWFKPTEAMEDDIYDMLADYEEERSA